VDTREASSGIPEILREKGVIVQMKTLDVGDYVAGQYAVERKTTHDFLTSLYSGRMFEQAQRISQSYKRFLLIVEGDVQEALADLKNPRAFWGALLSMALDFDFKVFFTLDRAQTADLLYIMAKRIQGRRTIRPILVKKPRLGTTKDWQLSVLESLPAIGPKLAQKLLSQFGSVRKVVTATRIELALKGGVGHARAKRIQELLDAEFHPSRLKQAELA
jgi:DNA excision repair protein ERCC-4